MAIEHQIQLSSKLLAAAAENGQQENFITTYELMRQPSFALVSTSTIAANGHLQCLKYVYKEGIKICSNSNEAGVVDSNAQRCNSPLDCPVW